VAAGFIGFEITWRADVFSGAPQAGSAANYGTLGINFRGRKARSEDELIAALAGLSCEVPTKPIEPIVRERPEDRGLGR
jgi:hypothetical protein